MFGALVPAVYAMQSGPDNWFAQWRFMLGFGGAYVAVLIPFLMWLASWPASVPPAPGAMPVPEYRLKQRIRSLADAGLDVRIETPPGQPGRLLLARYLNAVRRTIGVRLAFV